jgi:ribosomal protein S18 acetylase RimI-like enzyme
MQLISVESIDKEKITNFFHKHWGSPQMVISIGVFQCDELDGFAVLNSKEEIIGLITYIILHQEMEIISLDSLLENRGIGSRLLQQAEKIAEKANCNRIKLITTNDNLHALGFYQKRGYRIVKVLPNAVNEARKVKPEIPYVADNGIPIIDELLLEKRLN